MRLFEFEVATSENWEIEHRVIRVRAFTLKGAFKRVKRKIKKDEDIYQVCTKIRGSKIIQPVWDFFNGDKCY